MDPDPNPDYHDGGQTLPWISNITDQVNGRGMTAQPAIMGSTEELDGYLTGKSYRLVGIVRTALPR